MCKRFVRILLCFAFLLSTVIPVYATQTEESENMPVAEIKISTVEEFITFAENCRLDSYSRNLAVILENDIDLCSHSFEPVPIFSGSFNGNGHVISGLSITADGSVQGLFRYLTATALVQDLSIAGEIHPGGSRNEIGAIAGQNEGSILNCTFRGNISGGDYVGGIVGVNTTTGTISNCSMEGTIHADHFVGGIAGENHGVIRNCSNLAQINTTPQQNDVSLSDITLDSLTNTEAANTVTDIGGIAGISTGVIRECENSANIGYHLMGYNIGGIAGTQSGYIVDCENLGDIQGRKEVGGIVGQMEPTSVIEYTEDTLQILQKQLGTMTGLVNQASGNAKSNAGQIASRIGVLREQTETARDAVETLIPNPENPELPDPDVVLAAQNTLSKTLNKMPGTLRSIASAAQTTVNRLSRDLDAISSQVSAMGNTINGASDNLGGSITDVSDLDTPDILTGKVESCINYGAVLSDLNAGGIAGAIAVENDLDIMEDWQQLGEESLNFDSQVRAVVLNSENHGITTGKKQNVGGIVGWQSLGLVKECSNSASVIGDNADYVGGITGLSTGYIRNNYAKCELSAGTYAGGIAGSATIATDCISMVQFLGAKEKTGAILGDLSESNTQNEEMPVFGNIFPEISRNIGAIDGISYAELAEPVTLNTFLSMDSLPDLFRNVTVRFLYDDGTEKQIKLSTGDGLSPIQIPEIPVKNGFSSKWEGLSDSDFEQVLFDKTVRLVHTPYRTTIQSDALRESGLPVLLTEGIFTDNAAVRMWHSDAVPELSEEEMLLEVWSIHAEEGTTVAHFLLPDETGTGNLKLLLCGEDGVWKTPSFKQDGSYLVFRLDPGETQLALVQEAQFPLSYLFAGIGFTVALILAVIILWKKRSGKKDPEEPLQTHQ